MALSGPSVSDDDSEESAGIFSEINITPLTDVFLVLLIIFMVTTTVITQNGVKVNLPKTGAASNNKEPPKGVTVTLDPTGKIFIDQKVVPMDQLQAAISAKLAAGADKSVILAGDRAVLLGEALKVMDIAKKAGAEKFAIATKTEK